MSEEPGFADANVSVVTDRLLVGGDVDLFHPDRAQRQVAELRAYGVTHVVDLRIEWDDSELWNGTGVEYLHLPIDDAGQHVPGSWFDRAVGAVLAMLDRPGSRVLVHCHMGVNRGPSLGYAVLLGQGHDPVEALALVRRARPIAHAFYAEDALEWWLAQRDLSRLEAEAYRARMAAFRRANPVDVHHVIADIRSAERDGGPTI